MFYCNSCAERLGWPKSVMRWNSVCEMCETPADCNDIPSVALPDQSAPTTREERE